MSRAKKKFCVVVYDVADDRRRTHISKVLEKYGVRVNFSVFECMFTENQYARVQQILKDKMKEKEDIIVYYPVCVNCFTKIVYQPEHKKTVKTVEFF
jgi:CRISPR-associated protein Cas2